MPSRNPPANSPAAVFAAPAGDRLFHPLVDAVEDAFAEFLGRRL
jgi:hypothetical protein